MAKYSTGGGGGGSDGDACELCGKASNRLSKANVAGASLLVCPDCSPHDDSRKQSDRSGGSNSSSGGSSGGSNDSPVSRKKRAAQKQAEIYDANRGDSSHWEKEGTNYERDRLPYLVANYADRLEAARQDAGLTIEEIAETLGVDEDDYEAVEQGRAARAGVGGSLIRAIEAELEIELVDE